MNSLCILHRDQDQGQVGCPLGGPDSILLQSYKGLHYMATERSEKVELS